MHGRLDKLSWRALRIGALAVYLAGGLVAPLGAAAEEPLGELEEPGQVERLPVEESAKESTPDPNEAVTILPDSEAIDPTIDDDEVEPEEAEPTPEEAPLGDPGINTSGDDGEEAHPDEATTIMPDSEAVDHTIVEENKEEVSKTTEKGKESAPSPEPKSNPAWSIRWQNAFIVQRVDDPRYQFLFGGRIQNDWGLYDPDNDLKDSFGGQGTGTKFRRARLYFQGQFFRFGFFKAEYDFSDGDDGTAFADVYAGLNLPNLGLLRVGYFKEPFSLEAQNSSNFISFNERSAGDVFNPFRNSGVMLNGNFLIRDSTYSVAFMRRTDDLGEGFSNNEDYRLTMRFTGLPYFKDGGARLLHLEFGYSHQFADDDLGTQYAQRPANEFANNVVDTGVLAADNVDLFNFGIALVEGPLSFQGEATISVLRGEFSENPVFWSAYAEVAWWITGENRRYLRGRGVFSRVVPKNRFDPEKKTWGALETAIRYSWLDLSNDGIRGGTLSEWSFALNWVLFSNMRVSNNYVLSRAGDRPGSQTGLAHSWVTRIQVDF